MQPEQRLHARIDGSAGNSCARRVGPLALAGASRCAQSSRADACRSSSRLRARLDALAARRGSSCPRRSACSPRRARRRARVAIWRCVMPVDVQAQRATDLLGIRHRDPHARHRRRPASSSAIRASIQARSSAASIMLDQRRLVRDDAAAPPAAPSVRRGGAAGRADRG